MIKIKTFSRRTLKKGEHIFLSREVVEWLYNSPRANPEGATHVYSTAMECNVVICMPLKGQLNFHRVVAFLTYFIDTPGKFSW